MTQILTIDQSTSATKAIIFDESGVPIDRASIDHRQIYPRPGWVEHDAEEIWRNTLAVINQLKLSDPQFLSITNQRETIVVFDRKSCAPLHNAIVWQCRRGESICHELREAGRDSIVAHKTGLKLDTYFSASKLTWVMRNQPEIARRIRAGDALIGTMDVYLVYRLTQGKVFATDTTNACRTLLFDIGQMRWDEQLCEMFEVPMHALPQVRDSRAIYGESSINGRAVPICGVMGDSQAALFAQRCFAPGTAKVTIGTGSSVLLNIGENLRHGEHGAVSTIAWTIAGKPTYCFEGIINYSAATIAWLKDQLGLIKDASETEAAAKSIPDNGGVYLVPAFAGLGAPYWSPNARAAIVGMTSHTNRNHIIRAALESISYQIADVLEMMKSQAGVELKSIHADGGATKNQFLCQFIADITQLDLIVSENPDCSALGAAMAGMLGMSGSTLNDLARLPQEASIFRPEMRPNDARILRTRWERAVGQVLAGVR